MVGSVTRRGPSILTRFDGSKRAGAPESATAPAPVAAKPNVTGAADETEREPRRPPRSVLGETAFLATAEHIEETTEWELERRAVAPPLAILERVLAVASGGVGRVMHDGVADALNLSKPLEDDPLPEEPSLRRAAEAFAGVTRGGPRASAVNLRA